MSDSTLIIAMVTSGGDAFATKCGCPSEGGGQDSSVNNVDAQAITTIFQSYLARQPGIECVHVDAACKQLYESLSPSASDLCVNWANRANESKSKTGKPNFVRFRLYVLQNTTGLSLAGTAEEENEQLYVAELGCDSFEWNRPIGVIAPPSCSTANFQSRCAPP